jgi:hypothetical protein
MLQAWAPFIKTILQFTAVVKVVLIWKIHWPSWLVEPFSVKVPEQVPPAVGKVYMPGGRIMPPRFDEGRAVGGDAPFALLYAVRQAASAVHADGPPADFVPVHIPGGKPVIEVPGQVPQLPVMTVLPVLVRDVPAIAPHVEAAPIKTGSDRFSIAGWASAMAGWAVMRPKRASLQALDTVNCMVKEIFGVKVWGLMWCDGRRLKADDLDDVDGNGDSKKNILNGGDCSLYTWMCQYIARLYVRTENGPVLQNQQWASTWPWRVADESFTSPNIAANNLITTAMKEWMRLTVIPNKLELWGPTADTFSTRSACFIQPFETTKPLSYGQWQSRNFRRPMGATASQ